MNKKIKNRIKYFSVRISIFLVAIIVATMALKVLSVSFALHAQTAKVETAYDLYQGSPNAQEGIDKVLEEARKNRNEIINGSAIGNFMGTASDAVQVSTALFAVLIEILSVITIFWFSMLIIVDLKWFYKIRRGSK